MQFLINWIAIIEHNDKKSSAILRDVRSYIGIQANRGNCRTELFCFTEYFLKLAYTGKITTGLRSRSSFERGFQVAHNHKENPE